MFLVQNFIWSLTFLALTKMWTNKTNHWQFLKSNRFAEPIFRSKIFYRSTLFKKPQKSGIKVQVLGYWIYNAKILCVQDLLDIQTAISNDYSKGKLTSTEEIATKVFRVRNTTSYREWTQWTIIHPNVWH